MIRIAFRTGFTIIELLIVIVVIGILATVTIVSYVNIQDRAKNAHTIALVNQWGKVLELYNTEKNTYPTGSSDYVCLGTTFPAESPFAAEQCMVTPSWGVSIDTALMNDIEQTVGVHMPTMNLDTTTLVDTNNEAQHYRGLLYLSRNGGAGITYVIKGDGQQCTNGDSFFELGAHTVCRRVLAGNPYQGL